MNILKSVLLFLFIAAVLVFTFQNLEMVRFRFLSWHMEIRLSVVSVLLYIFGAFSGGLLFSMLKNLSSRKHVQKDDHVRRDDRLVEDVDPSE